MNIWSKMITALRGGVNEAGEAIVDSQALRILDQEIRDANEELKRSKDGLAEIMARKKLAEEKCNQLRKQIAEHEGYAVKALEKSDEALALEVAGRIAELEVSLSSEQEAEQEYSNSVDKLRLAIAQAAVAERHAGSNSKMRTAMESLERIKERQALKDAQIKAAAEMATESTDDSLKAKLEAAGIAGKQQQASDVLARIKGRQAEH